MRGGREIAVWMCEMYGERPLLPVQREDGEDVAVAKALMRTMVVI